MSNRSVRREPRWPAVVALVAVGGLYYALPSQLTFGPDWMVLAVVVVLMTPAVFLSRTEYWRVTQALGFMATGVVTGALIASLVLLVARLPGKKEAPAAIAGVGGGAVGDECAGVCFVVLEAGCGWSVSAGFKRGAYGWGVFVSADDVGSGVAEGDGGRELESGVCGLFIFGVQYQYGIFADGCAGAVAVG